MNFLSRLFLTGCFVLSFVTSANSGWLPMVNYYLLQPSASAIPQITGHRPLTFSEDSSFSLSSADFSIVDSDSQSFTLSIQPGANYSVINNVITPNADFFGMLQVPVTASDGVNSSAAFVATMTITNVNDAPVTRRDLQFQVTNSDAVHVTFAQLFTDVDNDSDFSSFSFQVNQPGNNANLDTGNGTFSPLPAPDQRNFAYRPKPGFVGDDVIKYWITDNKDLRSAEGLITIRVTASPVPVVASQNAISVQEDTSLKLLPVMFQIVDYDSTIFTVTPLAGQNYKVVADSIIPNNNFYGELQVPIRVSDGSNQSPTFIAKVQVNNVNDAPNALSPLTLGLKQNQSSNFRLTGLFHDVDGISNTTIFKLLVDNLDCSASCSTANGRIFRTGDHPWASFLYTPNQGFTGLDPINYKIKDSSGLISNPSRLTYDVAGPAVLKITAQQTLTLQEDQTLQLLPEHFTVAGAEPGNSIEISAVNGENYRIENNQLIPAKDFYGVLNVGVVATSGGISSGLFNAKVTVNNVNDKPLMVSEPLILNGLTGASIDNVLVSALFSDADLAKGAESLAGYTVQFVNKTHSTNGVTTHGKLAQTGTTATGHWRYTPNPGFSGEDSVLLWVKDSQGVQAELPATLVFKVAEQAVVEFDVSATANAGGTVTPPIQKIRSGEKATITLAANAGFKIQSATGCGGALAENTYRTGVVTANCQVQVVFSPSSTTPIVIYIHTDALGSVIAETDENGNVIKRTEYKPFGENKDQ
ncbi:hypothetical protein A5320_20280 [Rheinheimera sp. SA_1]|uniref:tandem-95 repeat protein n=1 Tax=Rheinheimera sp. SA_1 TaxID=1827365 RepID=UPI0008024AE1|nr:tandem-95 repeat protein [Rheinheimera sp. SA_1]OBP13178.1 hypothetical protein A5320_20280 [Rheinheimera sp. SA_1]